MHKPNKEKPVITFVVVHEPSEEEHEVDIWEDGDEYTVSVAGLLTGGEFDDLFSSSTMPTKSEVEAAVSNALESYFEETGRSASGKSRNPNGKKTPTEIDIKLLQRFVEDKTREVIEAVKAGWDDSEIEDLEAERDAVLAELKITGPVFAQEAEKAIERIERDPQPHPGNRSRGYPMTKHKKATFTITVEYNPEHTDEDSVGNAVDTLLETALSTPGILDEYGNPEIGPTDGGLQHMLTEPDTDDAHYILREVYKHMGIPLPGFLSR